jgi:hypothetical protein
MDFIGWILARLKEPSTYAGFSGLAMALGVSGQLYEALAAALAGVAALIAVALSEKTSEQ